MYCVYLTTYLGDKLHPKNSSTSIRPKYYIGSTLTKNIAKGYRGSVRSKKYRAIWEQELIDNFNLFDIEILSVYPTQEAAIEAENYLQEQENVIRNPEYVNMAKATKNGCFGKDMSGDNQWSFGQTKETNESIALNAERMSGEGHWTFGQTVENNASLARMSEIKRGQNRTNNPVWKKYSEEKQILNIEQRLLLISMRDNQGKTCGQIWKFFTEQGIQIGQSTISKIYNREKKRLAEEQYTDG